MNFQRMNFFKGLFARAEDWQKEQLYHVEKHRLHNRCFHTPGVVTGRPGDDDSELKESLRVSATPAGSISVQPGYAIDAAGRDLYLSEPVELDITPTAEIIRGRKQVDLYVYIAHQEVPIDERQVYTTPDQSGHAFWQEKPIVGWTDREPDNKDSVELARFTWRPGHRITQSDLDTSHVQYAGANQPGILVRKGKINVAQTKISYVVPEDPKVLIEQFPNENAAFGAFYIANAFPVESTTDARIQWRIESSRKEGKVRYDLYLKNFGNASVDVAYEVYRLNVRSV